MKQTDLEKRLAVILLNEPKLINTVDINLDWMQTPLYKAIVHLFQNEIIENSMEIYSKLKKLTNDPTLNYQTIIDLTKEYHLKTDLEYLAKELQLNHLRKILFDLQKANEQMPNKETEELMFDTLAIMQKINTDNHSGDLSETLDRLEYELENDSPQGVQTFGQLKTVLGGGLRGGNLVIIGARPAVGKSAWSLNLIQKAVERQEGMRVDLFSAEMDKKEVLRRFISLKTGIDTYKLKNANMLLNDNQKQTVRGAIDFYKQQDIKVHNQTFLSEILRTIRNRASEMPADKYLVVIDYIGLLRIANSRKDRRLEIEQITRELKVVATELSIPIVALSQLSRAVENRQDKTPMLSDLRESGSIEQDANVVGFLYQDTEKEYPVTGQRDIILRIAKNRDGSLGNLNFNFYPSKMKFEERFT